MVVLVGPVEREEEREGVDGRSCSRGIGRNERPASLRQYEVMAVALPVCYVHHKEHEPK